MNESQATCAVDLTADPLVEPLVDAWASDLIDNLPVIDQRWQGGCVQFVGLGRGPSAQRVTVCFVLLVPIVADEARF